MKWKDFSFVIAKSFINDLRDSSASVYYVIGQIYEGQELSVLSEYNDRQIKNNIIYYKKITPNDVSLVCKRKDWEVNSGWDRWDDLSDMSDLDYYCYVPDNMGVYKCLDNGVKFGQPNSLSTVKPSGKSLYPQTYSDGYTWKYMYDVPQFKYDKFATTNKIPVQKSTSDYFYNNGEIESITILDGGTGYTDLSVVSIQISGDVVGSGASAEVSSIGVNGEITGINIIDGGSNYIAGANINILSVSGYGAKLTTEFDSGQLTNLFIETPGLGYSIGEEIIISVGGASATPIVNSSGSIVNVILNSGGAGYATAPTIGINVANGYTPGTGIYGNLTAKLSTIVYQGQIVNILIEDPGVNYPTEIATEILISGDGTGATAIPAIFDGKIVGVYIDNPGHGYTSASITAIGDGTGAKLIPHFSQYDITSRQAIVEQTTIIGGIHACEVLNPGSLYIQNTELSPNNTVVTVSGDGTGCLVSPVIFGGEIIRLDILSPGKNYTYADFSISCLNRNSYVAVDAQIRAIFPPSNGHGYDAISELNGNTVCINTHLMVDSNVNLLNQDYRNYGIVYNPKYAASGKIFRESFQTAIYKTMLDNTTNLIIDEILVFDGNEYVVVAIVDGYVYMQGLNNTTLLTSANLIAKTDYTRTYTVVEILNSPTIDKSTGELLYVSNETPFIFNEDQGIVIKTYIKF